MVKIEAKKMAGDVVDIERIVVKIMVMASKGHLRSSTHDEEIPEMNVKDLGKVESKGALSMPLRRVPG